MRISMRAVYPETGHAEGLLSPQLSTKIINSFLERFSKTIPTDEHAVMTWEGAVFHTSKSLKVPENVPWCNRQTNVQS